MDKFSWVEGETYGTAMPAAPEGLADDTADFLTRAFRASGVLADDNRVASVVSLVPLNVGGSGSKLLLRVEYSRPAPDLHTELFVKFSRNFDDPVRDAARHMLVPEIRFAQLSTGHALPITVPRCYFADICTESQTGLMVTEVVPFGVDGVEPQLEKCMDHLMADPVTHYRPVVAALARLSGTFKAGLLSPEFQQVFPFDRELALAADPLLYRGEKLERRLSRLVDFVARHARLFPANVTGQAFLEDFPAQVRAFVAAEQAVRAYLYSDPDYVALCHWNANIDNAWYWRGADGELHCGLMDWGAVGQMHVAKSLYGSLSGARPDLWRDHLDGLLDLFVDEFSRCGGPALDRKKLRGDVLLFTALMGVAYLMDAPALIERYCPQLADIDDPLDDRLLGVEDARVQHHMLTMFLNQWQGGDMMSLVAAVQHHHLD